MSISNIPVKHRFLDKFYSYILGTLLCVYIILLVEC